MKKLFRKIFRKPVIWLADRLSSHPKQAAVFSSLSQLLQELLKGKTNRGVTFSCLPENTRFIILSDQHKGGKDAADDFAAAESNYMTALSWYYSNDYTLINLGDCEELWENKPTTVIEKNRLSLLEEAKFLQQTRYYRIFGNHDLEWNYLIPRQQFLKPIFGEKLKVYEGLVLQIPYNNQTYSFLLTHGHQGDQRSDGNAFSKWFVAAIWTPIQRFLDIHTDTISDSFDLVDRHNVVMYEWTLQYKNTFLISGHTHKPVFASLDHIDRITKQLEKAKQAGNTALMNTLQTALEKRRAEYAGKQFVKTMAQPTYFNTGCCCFSDGDITGIEIAEGFIRLIKWEEGERKVLEESPLYYLFDQLPTQ